MLHRNQFADIGSNASKVVILMSTTKNVMVPPESSKMRNLRTCSILIHIRHLKNCLRRWMFIDSPLENTCRHVLGMIQKAENWVLHELKEKGMKVWMFDSELKSFSTYKTRRI
ncbi:hypothetical protein Trydic_g2231 [Trypoxylus dichotomus]